MHLIKVRVQYILIITKSVKTSGHQLSWQSNRLLICGSQVRSLHGSLKLLAKNKELFFNTVPIVQRQSARLWIWLSSVRSRLGTLGAGNKILHLFFWHLCPPAPVAHLDRATDFESVGRRFESSQTQQERFFNKEPDTYSNVSGFNCSPRFCV